MSQHSNLRIYKYPTHQGGTLLVGGGVGSWQGRKCLCSVLRGTTIGRWDQPMPRAATFSHHHEDIPGRRETDFEVHVDLAVQVILLFGVSSIGYFVPCWVKYSSFPHASLVNPRAARSIPADEKTGKLAIVSYNIVRRSCAREPVEGTYRCPMLVQRRNHDRGCNMPFKCMSQTPQCRSS